MVVLLLLVLLVQLCILVLVLIPLAGLIKPSLTVLTLLLMVGWSGLKIEILALDMHFLTRKGVSLKCKTQGRLPLTLL